MQYILLFILVMRPKNSYFKKSLRDSQISLNLVVFKKKQNCAMPSLSSEPRVTPQHRKIAQNIPLCLDPPRISIPSRKSFSKSCAPETLKLMQYLREKGSKNSLNSLAMPRKESDQRHSSNFQISERPNILSIKKETNKENFQQKPEPKLRKMGLKKLVEKPKFNCELADKPPEDHPERLIAIQYEPRKQEDELKTAKATIHSHEQTIASLSLELKDSRQLTRKLKRQNSQAHIRYRQQVQTLKNQLSQNQTKVRILEEQLRLRQAQIVGIWTAQFQQQK